MFSQGSTGPLQMIPVCGGLIAVFGVGHSSIGRPHMNQHWTRRAAVLLPLVVCCGGAIVLAAMFGALGAWSSSHH
jgi:hypothetical protein